MGRCSRGGPVAALVSAEPIAAFAVLGFAGGDGGLDSSQGAQALFRGDADHAVEDCRAAVVGHESFEGWYGAVVAGRAEGDSGPVSLVGVGAGGRFAQSGDDV